MSMTIIGLFVFSFIPLIIISGLFVWSRNRGNVLRTIILGATIVHEFLLITFPPVYSIFTDFELEGRMVAAVVSTDLLWVMIGESIFILMFALGLVIGMPSLYPRSRDIKCMPFNKITEHTNRSVINLLIAAGVLMYAPKLFLVTLNVENSLVDDIVYYLTGVFWYMPLVVCAFLITRRGELSANPVRFFLALLPLISLVVIGITSGVRGRVVWVISLLIVAGIFNRQKKIIAISLAMAILFLPIFAALGDRDMRSTMASSTSSRTEIYTLVYEVGIKNISNSGEMMKAFLESFSWRAQGVRNSVILYKDFDQGGGGFRTYTGALFAFIPRGVWPEKPMLGSLDHTESESAMYKVMLVGHGEPGTMGPLLASAHAYWEGGWIWLVVAGLITGVFWNSVFRYCRQLPDIIAAVITLSFAAALLIDGLLTMLTPLYAFIIRFWLSLLPLFIVYISIRIINIAIANPTTAREAVKSEK